MALMDWFKRKGTESKEYGEKVFNTKELKENGQEIKKMAKIILSPKEQIKNAHQETFQQAKERLNVNDAQLVLNYRNYVYIFYISIGFTALCFFTALFYLFFQQAILSAIASISIMSFCLVNAFKFSFRAFQIKHQKLCSVKEWWDRSEEWFPPLQPKKSTSREITKVK